MHEDEINKNYDTLKYLFRNLDLMPSMESMESQKVDEKVIQNIDSIEICRRKNSTPE
jgi:hypothetical protein